MSNEYTQNRGGTSMNHKLIKYIDDSLKKVNVAKPYSQHILVSSVYLCFARWLGIKLTPHEKNKSYKQWLNTEILKLIETKNNNFEDVIGSLSDYVPNDMVEILITTNMFMNNSLKCKDYLDLFEAFIHLLIEIDKTISTPESINKLCTLILNPQCGCLYDGTAGIGSTIICAHEHSERHNGILTVYGQESDLISYSILAIRSYMHNIDPSNIHHGDTLVSSSLNSSKYIGELKKFEFSIMFPPFGQSWGHIKHKMMSNRDQLFSELPPVSSSEWIFVQHMCASLHETYGRGIIGVSSGALFNRAFGKVRKEILQSGIIESVISLPGGILPFTMVPLCLIVLNKSETKNDNILMINATELLGDTRRVRGRDILTDENIEKIVKLYKERSDTEASSIVPLNELIDGILLPEKYINNTLIESSAFGKLRINETRFISSKWITLKEVGNFFRGVNISNYFVESENGNYSIINYQDIQNGELNIKTIKRYRLKEVRSNKDLIGKYRINPGDIIISCKGPSIKTCIVPEHTNEFLLSLNFAALRIDKNKYNPGFVKYYIDSPVGLHFIESRQIGSSIITLKIQDLESIPVPLMPLSQQIELCNQFDDGATRIYKQIELLQQELNNLKWDFYEKIGINAIVEKVDKENE